MTDLGGEYLRIQEIDEIMREVDADGDGLINYEGIKLYNFSIPNNFLYFEHLLIYQTFSSTALEICPFEVFELHSSEV